MDDVTLAHPLVDAVGPGFVVHETDAAVVELSSERSGLLLEAARAGVVAVVLTRPDARLTTALVTTLRRTSATWVVRDGDRYRAAGSDVVADDVATAMLARQVSRRSAAPAAGEVPWTEVLVSVHHPATTAASIGRTAEVLLAGLAGVAPTAWGAVEPATLPWSVAAVTAFARERAPRPTRLVAVAEVDGGTAAVQVRVERSATGITEETRLTLPTADAGRVAPTLVELARRQRVLLGTAWRTSGHADATVAARQLPLPVPLGAVVGAAAVRDLGVDPATLPEGVELVGPVRVPSLVLDFAPAAPAGSAASAGPAGPAAGPVSRGADAEARWRRLAQLGDALGPRAVSLLGFGEPR